MRLSDMKEFWEGDGRSFSKQAGIEFLYTGLAGLAMNDWDVYVGITSLHHV